jgi:hypothetical protein
MLTRARVSLPAKRVLVMLFSSRSCKNQTANPRHMLAEIEASGAEDFDWLADLEVTCTPFVARNCISALFSIFRFSSSLLPTTVNHTVQLHVTTKLIMLSLLRNPLLPDN